MTQSPSPRRSRLADQPLPRRVDAPAAQDDRPSYADLQAQRDAADFSPLAPLLPQELRYALGLPADPAQVVVDRALFNQIRSYLLQHPEQLTELPDEARDILAL